MFLAAASQRTSSIRLGHGIIQLTTNHPARVAERVSTLDLVSDGRVELGIGEGSTITELHPFDRRFRDKRAVWEDAVRALIPMFGDERRASTTATHFDFPLRNVLPKPLQKPHPPLWVACSQRDTIEAAGRLGHGRARLPVRQRRRGPRVGRTPTTTPTPSASSRLADYATNPNIAVVCGFMCCATDEEAHVKADGWTFFAFALRFYSTRPPGEPGSVNLWEEYQAFRRTPQCEKMHAGGLIGSPETIRTKLRKFEASHVDQVILLNQAGRNTHDDICASLELFAAEVMPEFVERHGEHQEWKQQVLAGDITLDEVDTSPDALPRPQRRPIETRA